MSVIGLTGLAGSGKSTVAKYLVAEHGYTLLSFAGPLKKMLRTLDPVISYDLPFGGSDEEAAVKALRLSVVRKRYDGNELEIKQSGYGKEYRRLLQVLGTDCIRSVDPDFWVNAAVAQMTDPNGKYVFDDIRFPNEAKVINGLNPKGLWNIHRLGLSSVGGHISEQHAGKMDEPVVIYNEDISALYDQVDHFLMLQPKNMDALYENAIVAPKSYAQGESRVAESSN